MGIDFNPSDREIHQILAGVNIDETELPIRAIPMPDYAVNTILVINDHLVLKTSAEIGHKLVNEARAMQEIADLQVSPALLASGLWPNHPERYYLLETKLPGQTLFGLWLEIEDSARLRYLKELVAKIELYQTIPTPHYCVGYHQTAIAHWSGSWIEGHDQYMHKLIKSIEQRQRDSDELALLDQVKQYYSRQRHSLDFSLGKKYSHGDLHLYNVLVDRQVSGIIDWEWAGLGGVEPEFELEALFRWAIYPQAIAEVELEDRVDRSTYTLVIPTILNSFSVLQQIPDLLQRLTIYQIEYELHKMALQPGKIPSVMDRLDAWLHRNPLQDYLT